MDAKFMERAIELSAGNVSAGRGGPFGAVVVRDNRIIAEATNLVVANHDPTAHAEILAIREACRVLGNFELRGCEIYTSCEPCPMCLGAIYWARPDHVYYANCRGDASAIGFDDERIYSEIAAPIGERKIPMTQMMREEAGAAFRAWKESEWKNSY